MTGIPTALQGDERGRVTAGVLTAMALAPVVLAMIIGRGLARPDFWSDATRWSSFYSVLPATPGMWVRSKLTAALLGAAATWILTVGTACLWLIGFGDFALLDSWWYGIRVYYSPEERLLLCVLLPIAATLLTWRCLIAGLADGMSGIPWLRRAADTLTAAVVIAFFVWILRGGDDETSQSPFQVLQPWAWTPFLPALLAALVAAKMIAASIAWTRVHARRLLSARAIAALWLAWLLGVAFLGATTLVLCGSVLWLRYLLFLAAILVLPLARVGIAILALHQSRSRP